MANFVVVHARCFGAEAPQHDAFYATEPNGGLRAAAPV